MAIDNYPICSKCWREMFPTRIAYRITEEMRRQEYCARCLLPTIDGIYVRMDLRPL